MKLYAITDRTLFAGIDALMAQVALWARGGIDFLQIREKDLAAADLTALTAAIVHAARLGGSRMRVLLNGPSQMAASIGCDGVHLTANLPASAIADAKASMIKVIAEPIISVSCHTLSEIERARNHGATLALFAPVFEKRSGAEIVPGQGLQALAEVCKLAAPMPVFALGGVSTENAQDCVDAGAAGIAAIRLFASPNWQSLPSSR